MKVLGIETSCDETAAAIVTGNRQILSNLVLSQWQAHRPYGGVVPEIAARSHVEHLDQLIAEALAQANLKFEQLDAVAATGGPGLIGGVIVGVMMGKAIASVHKKPFIAINHLEGHALTARLTENVPFPYLLLLVSGGHCQLLTVEGIGKYHLLGSTMDDALGEAFDKTAKLLGLPYPGGPEVEKLAHTGNPVRFAFPRPMLGRPDCDFSFSGLKTAIRNKVEELKKENLSEKDKADICASFQQCVGEVVVDRCQKAIAQFKQYYSQGDTVVVAGGVAANQYLRNVLENLCEREGLRLVAPSIALCTDNAAMIAWAGVEYLREGRTSHLNFEPRARWPLAELAQVG